ncbi:MAG: EamA family transporter [Deltaproteobacteria bacterium]|nr:EamA family transporter [Deltaproteobacteria bacterium]MBT4525662.1 EamA family transporter [Deltaproteobacteria bacterium]
MAGFLGFFGSFLFLYAVNKGPLSIIVTLSALYPVLTISMAIFFLGETITMKQGLGILLALVSMALISS